MHVLSITGGERSESRVIMSLSLYVVLLRCQHVISMRKTKVRTAPYLETCLTSSDASLKRGRGTMADGSLGSLGSTMSSCLCQVGLDVEYLVVVGL